MLGVSFFTDKVGQRKTHSLCSQLPNFIAKPSILLRGVPLNSQTRQRRNLFQNVNFYSV